MDCTKFFPSWNDSFPGTQTQRCVSSTGNKWTKNPNSLVKGLWKKNNFHSPFLSCILSLLPIRQRFTVQASPSPPLWSAASLQRTKASIWSSLMLSYFKMLLPFLWHKILCRAFKGLKARQSHLWNCLSRTQMHPFHLCKLRIFGFEKHDKQL